MTELSIDKSNWTKVKFGDVVFEPKESLKDARAESIEHVVGLEHIDSEDIHLRRSNSIDESTTFTKKFSEGDVLFGRRRAYLKKAAQASFSGICSGDITVMRANDKLLPELLPFLVNNDKFFDWAVQHSAGGLSPRVKFKDLAEFEFFLPPAHQQQVVCNVLSAVYNLILRDAELYQHTVRVKDSIIKEYLTSSKGKSVLSDYCEKKGVKIGPFGSLLHKEDYQQVGVPVIMPTDIIDGRINEESVARISVEKADELDGYRIKKDDILFPRRGDLTKRTLVKDHQEGWICGTGTIRARLAKGIDPKIVYFAVSSGSTNNWLAGAAVGTTMPNLNVSTVSNIPLHLPEGEEAETTVRFVEGAIESLQMSKSRVVKSRNLMKSLINQVF